MQWSQTINWDPTLLESEISLLYFLPKPTVPFCMGTMMVVRIYGELFCLCLCPCLQLHFPSRQEHSGSHTTPVRKLC